MSKIAIVEKVQEKTGLSKKDAGNAVDAVFEAIKEQAEAGNSTMIKGFGTFKNVTSKARTGRNPQTGASVQIPEKTKLKFTASKSN